MEDNVPDDDIEVDLAPIMVQLAYVYQLLGQTQEAMEGYLDLLKKNPDDLPAIAMAANNLVSLRGPKDISDSLKKLDRFIEKGDNGRFQLAGELEYKLSAKQKEAIYLNRVLLLLHANRMDQVREYVTALQGMFPDSVMPMLLQATVYVRENKEVKAEEVLGQFAERFPDKSKALLLAKAQLAAAAGHALVAAESLAQIPDIQHMPGTVATIVALRERAGDVEGANAVFDAAIKWCSNAMTEDNKLNVIMTEAAAFKLKHGREEEAFHLFEELVKSHSSVDALAGLVTTAAHVDIDKAEAYEKQLKPLPGLNRIDVDSLEKTSGAKPSINGSHTEIIDTHEETKTKEKPKKKRKRKPRYPKGFDPANPGPPPDPERWLPRRERSSYRPKRKDKRVAHVRGSQGAVVREKHDAVAPESSRSGMDGADSSAGNSKANQPSTSKSSSQNAGPSKASKKKSRRK
ncbi:Signal recognition particle subunit SRP72-like protein [Drosera capensis]